MNGFGEIITTVQVKVLNEIGQKLSNFEVNM
jgi:hypothetical protein